jgi:hypothetical protein
MWNSSRPENGEQGEWNGMMMCSHLFTEHRRQILFRGSEQGRCGTAADLKTVNRVNGME